MFHSRTIRDDDCETMNASRCDQMNGWFIAAVTTDARLRRQQPVSEAEQQQRDQQQKQRGATHHKRRCSSGKRGSGLVRFVSFVRSANKRGGRRRRRCRLFGAIIIAFAESSRQPSGGERPPLATEAGRHLRPTLLLANRHSPIAICQSPFADRQTKRLRLSASPAQRGGVN